MIMIFGDMKLLPPDMNTENNFMSGKCEFHVAEKVDFPDGWQVSALADSARETHSAYLSGAWSTYTSHNNKILNSIFICMFHVYVCVYTYMYTCGTFTGACLQTQQLARVMVEA